MLNLSSAPITTTRRRLSRALLLVGLSALMLACPTRHTAPADALTEPAEITALASAYQGKIQTLAVEARATHYGDVGAFKGKVAILVRRPGDVHISTLSPTDDLVGVLSSDGKRFVTFQRGARVCQRGDACPRNMARFLPLAIDNPTFVGMMMGRAVFIDGTPTEAAWDGKVGAYRVELVGGGDQRQLAWVEHGSGRILRTELFRGKDRTFSIDFSDVRSVDGHRIAHRVEIKIARGNTDLRLDFRTVDVNLELADSAFSIPCPDGTTIEELSCER